MILMHDRLYSQGGHVCKQFLRGEQVCGSQCLAPHVILV